MKGFRTYVIVAGRELVKEGKKMYRKFMENLLEWEERRDQRPIMVTGARQVGKTWLLQEFCRQRYSDYIYINLEERKDCLSAFEGNLDPDTIIRTLEQLLGRRIESTTALFMDEIQQSERAITSLKYFCEAKENYRVLCAGSLLGVKLKRFEGSFPVGKVKICGMYPMDFEEFLLAIGEEYLRDGIKDAFLHGKPLPEGVHEKAIRLYHDYLFVGGMPEMVKNYIDNEKNVQRLDASLYQNLKFAYLADMSKHVISPAESLKITEVYASVPSQLARDNPKFKYKDVRPNANKRDFMAPLDWLFASGMVYRISKVSLPEAPLGGYEEADHFKLYLSDVGMLTHMCGLRYRDLLPDVHNIYKGGVVENYVIQQLKASGKELYYYKPSDSMEIDLLWDDGECVVPIEIKSGRNKRSTSLRNFRDRCHPPKAIRFSELNFGQMEDLLSIPLYAVFCV